MPYVVPKTEALQYIGSNDDAVRQILSGYDYWTEDTTFTGSGLRYSGADGDSITLTSGDYLVYDLNSVRRMSQSDYELRFREIS